MNVNLYGIQFGIFAQDVYTLKEIVDNYPDKEHLRGIYNLLKDEEIKLTTKQKKIFRDQISENVSKMEEDIQRKGLLSSNLTRFTDTQILKWIMCYIDDNPQILE